jgi:hypothetical protein
MDRLIDEIVQVSVSDAVAAATPTSVNTVAVLGVSTKAGAADVSVKYSQQEVEDEYDSASDLSKTTRSFFLEGDNPGRLVCVKTAEAPTAAGIASVLDSALSAGKDADGNEIDFYHVVLRFGAGTTAASVIALIEGDSEHEGLEDWCVENFRLAHVELSDRSVAEAVLDGLSKAPTRVAVYFHEESTGKSLAAALVADRCGNDPARGTWAHKNLASVVADATSKTELVRAGNKGLNVYVKIAGVERTYFGTVGNGASYIDSVVKKDWLRFRTQEAIFDILGSANGGDGVDYNDSGIAAVAAAITEIFTTAQDNDHRYVLPDSFDVSVPKYADIPAEDKAKRNLPDVKATFSIQESIHTVKTVELQVVA